MFDVETNNLQFAKESSLARWRRGGDSWPVKVVALINGNQDAVTGCVAELGAIRCQTPAEMERILGLRENELRDGAVVMVLARLPDNFDEFEPAGSTITPTGPNGEYPVGKGVEQWILLQPIPVAQRIVVPPGGTFQIQDESLYKGELPPLVLQSGVGGLSANHPALKLFPLKFAPSVGTGGKEKNTIRMELIPVACWRLDSIRFGSGQSFLSPETREEMGYLEELVARHPKCPLSVFGHADGVGSEKANKLLSGQRAAVVYGLLTRNVSVWEDIYSGSDSRAGWGQRAIKTILAVSGCAVDPSEDLEGSQWRNAVEEYQEAHDLPATGYVNKTTRLALFATYMDALCGPTFRLAPTRFLARGADPRGRGDYQGCGEFNPVVVRGTAEAELDEVLNAPNRRVVVVLFREGTTVPPNRWPCPSVSDDSKGCRRRFWSDHGKRREAGGEMRVYDETRDTFACRFYDRISGDSPCERTTRKHVLQIYLHDEQGTPIALERYQLEVEGTVVSEADDKTDYRGKLEHEIDFGAVRGVLLVRHHRWTLEIEQPPPWSGDTGVRVRLGNLGFLPRAGEASPEMVRFARRSAADLCEKYDADEDGKEAMHRCLAVLHRTQLP